MTTISTEANHIAARADRFARLAPSIDRTLNADMVDALGGVSKSDGPGTHAPQEDAEPPTRHVDPTGDIATAGAVSGVRRRIVRITDALHDLDRMFDHLERVIRAEIATPAPHVPTPPNRLCENGCNRIKESQSALCAECTIAEGKQARADGRDPMCWGCGERRVETYDTANGPAFRGMVRSDDGGGWVPADGQTPRCGPCRKRAERAA